MAKWVGWKGKLATALVDRAVHNAGMKTAEEIGHLSDQQVPHDEGFLQDSKTIEADPNDKKGVFIGYGGGGVSGIPEIPYAIKWHEVDANFQKGRKKNYLKDPVRQRGGTAYIKNLQDEIDKAL